MAYDSRAPLESCPYENLDRQVGVAMVEPYYHHGCKKPMVEFFYERPMVNTETFGKYVDPEGWEETALQLTVSNIEHIDKIVTELKYHRNRLAAEAQALRSRNEKEPSVKSGMRSAVRKALSRIWITGARVRESVLQLEKQQ